MSFSLVDDGADMVRLKSCIVDFLLYPHYETLPFQRWQRKKKNQNNQGIPQPSLERDSENVSSTFDLIDGKMGKIGNMRVTDDVDAHILRFFERKQLF